MTVVTLKPGESLAIQFEDMDGEFQIHCDTKEHKNAIVVKETGGFNANVTGRAFEIMHLESFENRRRSKGEMAAIREPFPDWNNDKRKKGGDAHKDCTAEHLAVAVLKPKKRQ